MIGDEELLSLARRLQPLKFFPRDAEGVAEVAILIGELCHSPTDAEQIIRAILRSDLDEWPGMATFRRMFARQADAMRPRQPDPRPDPAAFQPPPPLDPAIARYQQRRTQAEKIWAEMPRPAKVERFLKKQKELLDSPEWARHHTAQETSNQAQEICIEAIAWELPDPPDEPPAASIMTPQAAAPAAPRPAEAMPPTYPGPRPRQKKDLIH